MPKKYTIREGFTFRGDDGRTASGGDVIELEDDVAELHAHKLELVRRGATKQPATTPASTTAPTGAGSPADADPADAGAGADAGSQDLAETDPAAEPQ